MTQSNQTASQRIASPRRSARSGRAASLLALAVALHGCASSGDVVTRPPPILATADDARTLAFDGAKGFGRYSRGGRGGDVHVVRNLDDGGPGSLRAAVEAKGPRIIVFAVSGTIALRSPLLIANDRITIAGQTAPGDGITVRDQPVIIEASDVVVRYLRSRLGDENSPDDADAIWIAGGNDIILDHVSASWSTDETLSVSPRRAAQAGSLGDVTVQWSFITESLNQSHHPKGSHGYGSLVRGGHGSRYSFHHNLWAHHRARMPRPGNYLSRADDPVGALMEFRHNIFHNWGASPASADGSPAVTAAGYDVDPDNLVTYQFVNNDYRAGRNSVAALAFMEANRGASAWFSGNRMNGVVPDDPWSLVAGSDRIGYRLAAAPIALPAIDESASAAAQRVLAKGGASRHRDAVDQRVVAALIDGSGGLIDSQLQVGGWPLLRSLAAPLDSDGDGLPDAWEKRHGLDPHQPDHNRVIGPDGRTAMDVYLDELAANPQ